MKRSKKSLQYAGLRPRTLRAYRTALDRFFKYVCRKKLSISKPHRLDRQVAEFIDLSYQEGEPMSYSGRLLSALKRFHPALRLELPIASHYFRNWQRCYVPSRAVPAHWELGSHDGPGSFTRVPGVRTTGGFGLQCHAEDE